MKDKRFVMGFVPETKIEREMFGKGFVQLYEAPKGVGLEVRLATEQEVGLFAFKALPPARPE